MRLLALPLILALTSWSPALSLKYEIDDATLNPLCTKNCYTLGSSDEGVTPIRVTVLTPNLLRFETATNTNDSFEDRPSLAFQNRDSDVAHTVKESGDTWQLTTSSVVVSITKSIGLKSVQVTSADTSSAFESWSYADGDAPDRLPGTIRTLDQTGPIPLDCSDPAYEQDPPQGESYHCTMGLFSKSGSAVVVDDVGTPLVDAGGFWSSEPSSDSEDFYLFTHGKDYKGALKDYRFVGGAMPLPPRPALGIWFTRWVNYNAFDVDGIVREYAERSIPLDIFVLDMNWHKKDDWTGYSWDERLFPYGGAEAIKPLKEKLNLRFGVNIHDDTGVGHWEDKYEEFAKAVGWDTSKNETVPFLSCGDETYAYALEDVVMKPLREDGVDFFWIDWQQGQGEGGCLGDDLNPSYNPTIQLNKLRITDEIRNNGADGSDRSMILARWGGLGNHRYQVGFSGDVDQVQWDRLAYQPYFSSTAANVGFGLWSHDLVGAQADDPELFLRWLQWGAFSSIFRTHDRGMSSGGCADTDEGCNLLHIWDLPQDMFVVARDFIQLRSSLMPYIYTATKQMHDTLLSFLRPMYLDFPDSSDAFSACTADGSMSQYMFGDSMFIAPVVSPSNATTGLAEKSVWVPPGEWVDQETGDVYSGPASVTLSVPLSSVPRFSRLGSVIPTSPPRTGAQFGSALEPPTSLVFNVYLSPSSPSLSGSGEVYSDDGETNAYYFTDDAHTITTLSYTYESGKFDAKLTTTSSSPIKATVKVHNCPFTASPSATFSAPTMTCSIPLSSGSASATFEVGGSAPSVAGLAGVLSRANRAKSTLDEAQLTPGSMTGGQGEAAKLSRVASLCAVLEHAFSTGDGAGFDGAVGGARGMMEEAKAEVADLLETVDEGERGRVVAALALLG